MSSRVFIGRTIRFGGVLVTTQHENINDTLCRMWTATACPSPGTKIDSHRCPRPSMEPKTSSDPDVKNPELRLSSSCARSPPPPRCTHLAQWPASVPRRTCCTPHAWLASSSYPTPSNHELRVELAIGEAWYYGVHFSAMWGPARKMPRTAASDEANSVTRRNASFTLRCTCGAPNGTSTSRWIALMIVLCTWRERNPFKASSWNPCASLPQSGWPGTAAGSVLASSVETSRAVHRRMLCLGLSHACAPSQRHVPRSTCHRTIMAAAQTSSSSFRSDLGSSGCSRWLKIRSAQASLESLICMFAWFSFV